MVSNKRFFMLRLVMSFPSVSNTDMALSLITSSASHASIDFVPIGAASQHGRVWNEHQIESHRVEYYRTVPLCVCDVGDTHAPVLLGSLECVTPVRCGECERDRTWSVLNS